MSAERRITLLSIWINVGLTALKLAAGVFGRSQALIADAIHSLSDFATDVAVLVGLRFSSRPKDTNHAYGHGKYETIVAAAIGLALAFVGVRIAGTAMQRIFHALHGDPLVRPAALAFWAAVLSIVVKEGLFRATMRVARATGSSALVANAWHHRSDALSSIATAAGVGAAAFLGHDWLILDPIAALFVSIFLLKIAWQIVRQQLGELTDQSLAPEICAEILDLARGIPGIEQPHNLRTRMVGRHPVIDLHVRLRADLPLREAHEIATALERAIGDRFGKETIANLHLEPYSG
ncbi:MAG TPA: cation diffusion facilitator family transporter [Kiritimatiellia bacterium]|nr:cation diffusion facilitator family transporter [Kiritimatiellia bacterium]